ncbi:MAG: 4'-phosphopantetheinyl transferase family protein [Streptosporangiaceae bacterium]
MGRLTVSAARPWSGRSIGPVPAGEVHLWALRLDTPLDAACLSLDSGELARAAGYRQQAHGARFAASRAGLRRLAASYLDVDPASLCFLPGKAGKPAVAAHASPGDHVGAAGCDLVEGFEFSLARTDDLALIAVSAAAIGADIERLKPRTGLADLVAARFPPREAACIAIGCGLAAGPGDRAVGSFYRHWTAREAYLKAVGWGLAGLRRLEVSCWPRPVVSVDHEPAGDWQLSFPAVSPAHAVAVVACDPVTRFEWLPA